MSWNKLAAIGDWSTVFPLKAIGIEAFPIENPAEVPKILHRLATSKEYGVIFVVETLIGQAQEVMREFMAKDLPAIILIPQVSGSQGLGATIVRETMKKAAGRDILSGE